MERDLHSEYLWWFGQPPTPRILDTALARFEVAKEKHREWKDTTETPLRCLKRLLDWWSSQHILQDDYAWGWANTSDEVRVMIWKEATIEYFGRHKLVLDRVPENDQWKRENHFLTGCPIKNVCQDSRIVYNEVLDAFRPVFGFTIPESGIKDAFEEWAPTDGSISELLLLGSYWDFFNRVDAWDKGRLGRLQTIYMDPEGFLKTSKTVMTPPTSGCTMSLPTSSDYYQAQSGGTISTFQKTRISPSVTDLYEELLFSMGSNSVIEDRTSLELELVQNGMWIRCAQMERKLNGDLTVTYLANMPWVTGDIQLAFLYRRLGSCFRRLPHLERIVFVKPVENLPKSCRRRCCCITLGTDTWW